MLGVEKNFIKRMPKLGRKLDYLFGLATGTEHNRDRSRDMLRQMERIGLRDTPATRSYLEKHLTEVLNEPSLIAGYSRDGTVFRESLLMGPGGGVKLETIWRGDQLITIKVKGTHR